MPRRVLLVGCGSVVRHPVRAGALQQTRSPKRRSPCCDPETTKEHVTRINRLPRYRCAQTDLAMWFSGRSAQAFLAHHSTRSVARRTATTNWCLRPRRPIRVGPARRLQLVRRGSRTLLRGVADTQSLRCFQLVSDLVVERPTERVSGFHPGLISLGFPRTAHTRMGRSAIRNQQVRGSNPRASFFSSWCSTGRGARPTPPPPPERLAPWGVAR